MLQRVKWAIYPQVLQFNNKLTRA